MAESRVVRMALTDPNHSSPDQALDRLILFGPDGEPILAKQLAGSPIAAPSGFSLSRRQFTVTKIGGLYFCDYDMQAERPPAGVTYYVSPAGLSGNSGLTPASPTTPGVALAKPDVGTISFAPGEYTRNNYQLGVITKSVNLIAQGPGVKLTGWEAPGLVWTATASGTSAPATGKVYQTTRSSTQLIADTRSTQRTTWGDYPVYKQVADLVSIVAAGQWAIVGSTVYVWPLADANLATDGSFLRLSINVPGAGVILGAAGIVVYAEGIDVEGGGNAAVGGIWASSAGTPGGAVLLARDCTSRYCVAAGAIGAAGASWCAFDRCKASSNVFDGFNYHSGTITPSGTIIPEFLEIDCEGYRNGQTHTTGATDNGSTSHDGCKGVRLNGNYHDNFGPNLVDVNTGTKTWNLNCRAASSTGGTVSRGWGVNSDGGEMWLDEPTIEDNAVGIEANNSSTIHVRRPRMARNVLPVEATTGSTIPSYA